MEQQFKHGYKNGECEFVCMREREREREREKREREDGILIKEGDDEATLNREMRAV